MVKRAFFTLFGLSLLFCLYGLSSLPLWVIKGNPDLGPYGIAVALWACLVLVSFFPSLAFLIHRVWFFKGRGEPILLKLLNANLLNLNKQKVPVQVVKKKNKLIITWRYQEELWCELLNKLEINNIYELHLTFDNATKTVNMSDRKRSINLLLCPADIKTGFFSFPKPVFRVTLDSKQNLDSFKSKPPYDYAFLPREIKSPVLNSILNSGWNIRFRLL